MVMTTYVRARLAPRDLGVLAVGVLAGAACTAGVVTMRHGPARANVIEGWAVPSQDGRQIAFGSAPTGGARDYEIADTPWAGPDGQWHGGMGPTCVGAGTTKATHVLLDVVNNHSAS